MAQKVLILGSSGTVGSAAMQAFLDAGWEVSSYQRGTDMTAAARGVDVIFNGLNPPKYQNWAENLPKITADVIEAAKASGATVLFPGNVYIYAAKPGTWPEDTTRTPPSAKGQIRLDVEAAYAAAAEKGVQTIILRAGDFITPDTGRMTSLDGLIADKATKGRIQALGPADTKRAYAYTPDLGRAFVALAEKRADLPAFVDLDFEGHTLSYDDIRAGFAKALKQPMRIVAFPWWVVRLLSPFVNLFREFKEMRYLYETSHGLSGKAFRAVLPNFKTTPLDDVIAVQAAKI